MMAVGAPQFAMGRLILWSVSWVLLLHSYCGAANEGDACPGGCVCRSRWDCATAPQPALLSPACCGPGLMCCPLTRVSQLKCEEYSRLVYAGTPDFSWLRSVLPEAEWPLLASRLPTCPLAALPLVVGGEEAVPGEIPHMALLGYGDPEDGLWLCGGALVSERWVLTAAHCLHGYRGPTRRVRLGTWVEGVPEGEDAQQVEVSARVPHPLYRPPVRYHDIGLLLLAARPVLSPAVRPACLHTEFAIPADKAQACGYGKVAFDADGAGDALRYVWLPLVTRVQCAPRYKDEMGTATLPRGLPRSLLCAGDPRGGKDTCQGDSGGPLQIIPDLPHCTYSLVGVTSFGKFCGFPESPGVYTRVSHYVPWIESIVWPREVQAASSAAHPAYPTTSDDLPHAVVKPGGIAWTVPLSLLGEGENSTGSSPIVDVTSQQVQM